MLFQLNIVFKELKNPDFFFFFFFFSLPLSSFKLSLSSSSSFKLWLIVFLLDFGEIMFPAPPLPIANFFRCAFALELIFRLLGRGLDCRQSIAIGSHHKQVVLVCIDSILILDIAASYLILFISTIAGHLFC